MRKRGCNPSLVSYNAIVHGLCTEGGCMRTYQLFKEVPMQAYVVTLNTVIKGLCQMGKVEDALKVLGDMTSGKFCSPDAVTFTIIITGGLSIGRIDDGLDLLHNTMLERGFSPGIVTYNTVLRELFELQKANEAMKVIRSMVDDGVIADSITNTIITGGLFESGQIDEAKKFWENIIWPSNLHDNYVYAVIVKRVLPCRPLE
ncbi:Pentatricopeptide repeat [Dillenia turbinata]|uniref:Pentatricopeptide repeat n=1 Tax=Dillenia turbinata TaxID=194707 RepID=A0AAN8Z9N3_9MAGN